MGGQSRRQSEGIAAVVSGILRAASICTSAVLLDARPTLAEAPEPAVLTADIPAQPLAQALEAFARQTGLQLVYVSEVVRDQRSHAVPSGLGAPNALGRMLEGTGLQFEYLTPRSVHILATVVGPPKQSVAKIPEGEAGVWGATEQKVRLSGGVTPPCAQSAPAQSPACYQTERAWSCRRDQRPND